MNKELVFKDLPLALEVQSVLTELGFTQPTEIQAQTLPILLEKMGIDFHGQAQTGTGKTLAFGLPLLHRIDASEKGTQAIVVAPTRELALQISESLKPFAQALGLSLRTIYGGVSMEEQVSALRRGVQIVVGTPGRINDHLRRGIMKLEKIKTLVLDEADIMLDMGFREEVDEILKFANKEREIWLFSATVKAGIQSLMKKHMNDPVSVRVSQQNVGTGQTRQYFCVLPMRSRFNALCRFIESAPDFYGFIFCQTKILTSDLADKLRRRGYHVGALHGDMSQVQRNSVIKKFKSREYSIVLATDVAARGIDIQDLTHVINYSLPEDHESYVHRTGRTGRAGKEGTAITFINRGETRLIQMIQRKFSVTIDPIDVPSRDDIIRGRMIKASEYLEALSAEQSGMPIQAGVTALVDQFDEAQLRAMMKSVIQEKFLDSILREEDIAFTPAAKFSGNEDGNQEIMLAVGTDDGLDQDEIVSFLKTVGSVDEQDLQKIRVIKRRTFVEVPAATATRLFESLRNTQLGGRPTRVQLVENDGSNRRNGDGGSSRSGGGRRFGGGGRPMRNGGGRRSEGRERRSFNGRA